MKPSKNTNPGCWYRLPFWLAILLLVGLTGPATAQDATIFAFKIHDQNCNGLWDGSETGLPNWTIYLDLNNNEAMDAGEPMGTTDGTGFTQFQVAPGTYTVAEVLQSGWTPVVPAGGRQTVTLGPGEAVDVVFGNIETGSIDGHVYDDDDGDGDQDTGEPGLEDRAVTVNGSTCAGDGLSLYVETDASGKYGFEEVPPGDYQVSVETAGEETVTQPSGNGTYNVILTGGEQAGPLVFGIDLGGLFEVTYDFGDAPDSYGTTLDEEGPRHIIEEGIFLGAGVDAEEDGQPEQEALGDDDDGIDDEDGVRFLTPLVPGQPATVQVTIATGENPAAFLFAWMDFDGDGGFHDKNLTQPGGERFIDALVLGPGVHPITFTVPATATAMSMARFRMTTIPQVLGPHGPSDDGEVEDYALLDYGDAPDATDDPLYPTLRADGRGARHFLSECYLGDAMAPAGVQDAPDTEVDGQPDAIARGDDGGAFAPPATDDEDAVAFKPPTPYWNGIDLIQGAPFLVRGTTVSLSIQSACSGFVSVWIDWNADGDWNDPGEQVFDNDAKSVDPGENVFPVEVPEAAAKANRVADPITTYMRVRLSSTDAGIAFPHVIDLIPDGEVEDYLVHLVDLDCGDAPFGTLLPTGACHAIEPGFYLGYRDPDREADGQPSDNALGDDGFFFGYDDEDGISFRTAQVSSEQAAITARVSQAGLLSYDVYDLSNGGYVNVFQVAVQPGRNHITFVVPAALVPAGAPTMRTYGRFRLTAAAEGFVAPTGPSGSGEVEDYRVYIIAPSGAGQTIAASLSGQKFNDINGNGVQDLGESGLDGWTIQLLDPQGEVLLETTTASLDLDENGTIDPETEQGLYAFPGLDPGQVGQTYLVREIGREGWLQTLPAPPDTAYMIALERGDEVAGLDFGNTQRGAVQGVLFEDANGNGLRDEDEPGLAGWTVFIDLNMNGVLDEDELQIQTLADNTTTPDVDETGQYRLTGVLPGEYAIAQVVHESWMQTFPEEGATHTVMVEGGMVVASVDFGNRNGGNPVPIETNPSGDLPDTFRLYANFPNPFNPSTNIAFDLPEPGVVTLKVYNLLGQEVAVLVDRTLTAGRHTARFDARHLPSGIYLYRIESGSYQAVQRMTLIK